MSKHDQNIEYVGDSRVPAQRVPNEAPSYSEYTGKTELFWPNFLLKEWMVAAVVLIAILILTVSHPAPLESKADPTNANYIPLPDWYFLFLYQLLKYPWASGPYVVFGSLVIPLIAFGALILAPWIDRGPERRPSKRPIATSMMLVALVSIVYLTYSAMEEHTATASSTATSAAGSSASAAAAKPPADFKPAAIWADKTKTSCQSCHGANLEGGAGPALWNVGSRLNEQQILDTITKGRGMMPPGGMFQGTAQEKQELAHYLSTLKGDAAK